MQRLLLTFSLSLTLSTLLFSQNLNTTLRSKMSFPNQTLANVWGYTDNGREYALLGGSKGMIIVDITNPDTPQLIVQVPGPDNLWKEIKTYSHYAYVTTEGGSGVQIIDLANLPSPDLSYHYYRGDSTISNQLTSIHALHIDVTKGFLYLWGSKLFSGGAVIADLNQDPYNPVYVGHYNQLGYIHDGYVDNDTMYSGHIYQGLFAIVNMADKSAPELLATQHTPDRFTHNTWVTDDRRTIFTTDERTNSFLAAYDISDPLDIQFLDKIQSNPGSESIVHNTYALGNYAVTSWYKDGFTIVDATRPDNLVQVGNFDTYPTTGMGFEGCWGVYPFFPSGNIIASNINTFGSNNTEFFVVTPNYKRACYLEGRITNAKTGAPINQASIEIVDSNPHIQDYSNGNGFYKIGQATSGDFVILVHKRGFFDFETTATLVEGEVVNLNIALTPETYTVSGEVRRQSDNLQIDGAAVWLYGTVDTYSGTTDVSGAFSIAEVKPGTYDVVASAPGEGIGQKAGQWIASDTSFTILLKDKYRRDALVLRDAQNGASGDALLFSENPFSGSTVLHYRTPENGCSLRLTNNLGQTVSSILLTEEAGDISIGRELPTGMYWVQLEKGGEVLQSLKLVKCE